MHSFPDSCSEPENELLRTFTLSPFQSLYCDRRLPPSVFLQAQTKRLERETPLAGTEDLLVRGIVEMTPVISGSRGYHARVTMGEKYEASSDSNSGDNDVGRGTG